MTENVKHVDTLRAMRSVFASIPALCHERDALDAAIALLQREAAGDGEVARCAQALLAEAQHADAIGELPDEIRGDTMFALSRALSAPRPTGTEYFSICSEHRPPQPDCRRCNPFATTPASAEPEKIEPTPNWCRTCGKLWSDATARLFCRDEIHGTARATTGANGNG